VERRTSRRTSHGNNRNFELLCLEQQKSFGVFLPLAINCPRKRKKEALRKRWKKKTNNNPIKNPTWYAVPPRQKTPRKCIHLPSNCEKAAVINWPVTQRNLTAKSNRPSITGRNKRQSHPAPADKARNQGNFRPHRKTNPKAHLRKTRSLRVELQEEIALAHGRKRAEI